MLNIEKIDSLNWSVSKNNNPIGAVDFDPVDGVFVAMKSDYKIYGITDNLEDAAKSLDRGWK